MKLNTAQKRRRSAGFAAMNTKRAPSMSKDRIPPYIEVDEPRVIIQRHHNGARPAMAEVIDKGNPVEGKPGFFKTKMVPVLLRRCRHLNRRHNADYIPPRRERSQVVGGESPPRNSPFLTHTQNNHEQHQSKAPRSDKANS